MTKAAMRKRWSDPSFLATLPVARDKIPKPAELRSLDLRGVPKLANGEPLWHFKIQRAGAAEDIDVSFGDGVLWVSDSKVSRLSAVEFKFDRASFFNKSTFVDCDFSRARFRLDMVDVNFVNCRFEKSTFAGGFHEYGLKRCSFERCAFTGSAWKNPYIFATTFTGCDFCDMEFHNALIAGFKHQDCSGVEEISFVECEIRSVIDLRTRERRTAIWSLKSRARTPEF
jgi:uncharacterized protein YjbI with pentapeptide repeats